MTDYAPVVWEVRVKAAPDRAFSMFTEHIGDWWPVGSNSVYKGTVAFESDTLVERSGEKVAVWAEVTRWDPPSVRANNMWSIRRLLDIMCIISARLAV